MTIGKDLGLGLNSKKHQPSDRLVLPLCLIGLEFEFEGVNDVRWLHREKGEINPNLRGFWVAKQDNSLHDRGAEYVFDAPMHGVDVIAAIDVLCDHAREQGYLVGSRTGHHVHTDCRDLTNDELKRYCIFYSLFERAIYRYAGENRADNPFCLPWYHAGGAREDVSNVLSSAGDKEEFKATLQGLDNRKYAGLNVESLCRFGSIEWRHLPCTTDKVKLLEWINICLRFKEACKRIIDPPEDTLGVLSGMGVLAFARAVLRDQFAVLDYPSFEHDVWRYGVPTAQDIMFREVRSWEYPGTKGVNPSFSAWKETTAKAKTKKGGSAGGLLPGEQDGPRGGRRSRAIFNRQIIPPPMPLDNWEPDFDDAP